MNFFTNYNVVKNTEINKICSQLNKISTCRNIPNQQTFKIVVPPASTPALLLQDAYQTIPKFKNTALSKPQGNPNRPRIDPLPLKPQNQPS